MNLLGLMLIILISKDLFQSFFYCNIRPGPLSDHDFVSFVFDVPESIKHGSGVWKLNNSLLDDEKCLRPH